MTLDFCRNWTFCKEGETPVTVDLPHDAMLLEKRDGGCRNGVNSGYFPGGKYAYGKTFELDAAMLGKSVALHFEGVYQNCKVYVNGKLVGSHRYGYTAFDVNISDFVESGENNIRVEVDNSLEPNCRWYSGSGIYRPVHLLIREQNHISQVHMETVQIHPAKVRVDVKTTQDSDITVDIYEGKKRVASGKPGILEVPEAKLWSAEKPFLYTILVRTDVPERALREIYLRGFEIAVRKSKPWAVMTSYNLVNGVHTFASNDLCTKALRNEWEYQGLVMTDWTASEKNPGEHTSCILAGNDLIMPGHPGAKKGIDRSPEKQSDQTF